MERYMKQDSTTYDIGHIKMLLQKYFDATMSPMEMNRLEAAAKDFTAGKLPCPDHETANDLRLINSISRFAESSLNELAESLPSGLEDRLNAHISMLADKDKSHSKLSWVKRWAAYAAAAAAVGILAVAGYHYLSSSDGDLSPSSILIADVSKGETAVTTDENPVIAPINQQFSSDQAIAKAETATEKTAAYKSAPNKANTTRTRQGKPNALVSQALSTKANSDMENSSAEESYIKEADEALSAIPPFTKDAYFLSEEAFRVMPTGVTAYIETSNLFVQPISTLSQSINSIYESVEILSEALSGVSTALQAVNYSLALLSDPL